MQGEMIAQDAADSSLALQAWCIFLTWDPQEDRDDRIPPFCRIHPVREGAMSDSIPHLPNIKLSSRDRELEHSVQNTGFSYGSCEGGSISETAR